MPNVIVLMTVAIGLTSCHGLHDFLSLMPKFMRPHSREPRRKDGDNGQQITDELFLGRWDQR